MSIFFIDWNPWGEEFEGADPDEDILKFDEGDEDDEEKLKSNGKTIEIWSKSALGKLYNFVIDYF